MSLRIAVVGCGIAGQAAAIFLAEAGHAVTVFERFEEPRPLGAGLLLQPTGLAVLRTLGLEPTGARIAGLEARTAGGRVVLDLAYADLHAEAHGLGIRRGALFDLLHRRLAQAPVELVTGIEIADIEADCVVGKTGRRHGPFELIVVADGAHSALRGRLMPRARAPLYPWGCLWANVADDGRFSGSGLLQQRVRGAREMMGLLPVGDGLLTLYWSVPADAAPDLDDFRRRAMALWPDAAAIVAAVQGFTHATYRHVTLPRWHVGRVLFIGDAAHGTSPQLGQGANLALMDAWTLADTLASGGDLEAFARRRTATVRYYRQASHLLTPFFQSTLAPLGWMRDAFMGPACRAPISRPFILSTLAGLRRGWLRAARLDARGGPSDLA